MPAVEVVEIGTLGGASEIIEVANVSGPTGARGPTGPTGPTGATGGLTGTAGGSLTGIYPNPGIANNAVGQAQIVDGSVTNTELASMASGCVKGRILAGIGAVTDLTGTQATSLLDVVTVSAKGLAPVSDGNSSHFLRADGTWAAPAGGGGGNVAADTIWDAKGDIIAGTGPDTAAKVILGANGQVLTADSTQPNGVKWAAPTGGAPSGSAGGSLAGTYPNPTIAPASIGSAEITNGSIANSDLANMVNNTVKGNVSGSGAPPVDLTTTQLTGLILPFATGASGAAPASPGGTTSFLRADGSWATPTGGGGTPLFVRDEAVVISSAAQVLDFKGAGVTAVNTGGGYIEVTVPGGGGVASVDGNTGAVSLSGAYEQVMAVQTINVNTDSPVTVAVGRKYTANLSGGSIVYNLPAAPVVNSRFSISVSAVAGSNTATVNCGGSDRFQTPASGATSKILNRVGQVLVAQYHAASAVWLVEEDVGLNVVSGYGTFANTATPGDLKVDVQVDVQLYNVAGTYTWNAPSWATATSTMDIFVQGVGGAGGGGARGPAGGVRGGGGGGASGCITQLRLLVGDVVSPVTVTIPTAPIGGAGATVDGPGAAGANGGMTQFGKYAVASGGLGGQGGTLTDGGLGGATGPRGMYPGNPGAKGSGVAATSQPVAQFGTMSANFASGGGGGGGGTDAGNIHRTCGPGGAADAYTDGSTTIPNSGGPSAGPGLAGGAGMPAQFGIAGGGGGGFRGNTADGTTGGQGGGPGGGGGGGGGSITGFNGGAGGTGGIASIRVVTRP